MQKRRRSIRLKGYDYSQPGAYFITVCTRNKECLFGEVINGEVILNEYGQCVEFTWKDLPNHNPNILLDAFIIMPNHVHGIVIIVGAGSEPAQGTGLEPSGGSGTRPYKKPSLFEIVRQFKTFSARRINQLRNTPGVPVWQRNYYEHIIRSEYALNKIREYIINNPIRWELDIENPQRKKDYKDMKAYIEEIIK